MPYTNDGLPYGNSRCYECGEPDPIDSLTELLCEACYRLENCACTSLGHDLEVWWIEHQAKDARRKAAEVEAAKRDLDNAQERALRAKRDLAIAQAKLAAKGDK